MSSTWSRTWNRITSTNVDVGRVNRAITNGNLDDATILASQALFDKTIAGRRLLRRLVNALLNKANDDISVGKYTQAWTTFDRAAKVALPQERDRISRETTELVELTIDHAESNLVAGKIAHARRLINELDSRQILDWRADRISGAAKKLKAAEETSAAGLCDQSIRLLHEAKNIRPDLTYIDSRIATCEMRKQQIADFTECLRSALLNGKLNEAETACRQLLVIAPNYKIAQDAQRRLQDSRKGKTSAGKRKTTYSPAAQTEPSAALVGTKENADQLSQVTPENNSDSSTSADQLQLNSRFILWIDGVGGFLVCPAASNTIGQAISYSNIQIPILGDLQRRHCRIETVDQNHLLQPLGTVFVDGQKTSQAKQLCNDQLIELEGGVNLKYAQSHPLSGSARLEFLSRHRTQPWSDSVLLVNGPLILGPDPRNHVHCPAWIRDLIIFQQHGKWFARTEGKLEIDGKPHLREGPLNLNSRIVGEEFTLSLEPLG